MRWESERASKFKTSLVSAEAQTVNDRMYSLYVCNDTTSLLCSCCVIEKPRKLVYAISWVSLSYSLPACNHSLFSDSARFVSTHWLDIYAIWRENRSLFAELCSVIFRVQQECKCITNTEPKLLFHLMWMWVCLVPSQHQEGFFQLTATLFYNSMECKQSLSYITNPQAGNESLHHSARNFMYNNQSAKNKNSFA